MNRRRAFKSDESFLEKISIGAIGTRKVFEELASQGHKPIELERGSMSFKIWKEIKIKRVRVPDILCVKCGRRVESRAKTKLEVSMSHSVSTPERGWDYGLQDGDYVAFVPCIKSGEKPIDWKVEGPPQYVPVISLREAYSGKKALSERPKGATEGFEVRVIWPSTVANADGMVTTVNGTAIQYRPTISGRTITTRLEKQGTKLTPLVRPGDSIHKNQVIASVVSVSERFECLPRTSQDYFVAMLRSASLSDRYVAAKALSAFQSESTRQALVERRDDGREHIYVRLEAAASLLKMGVSDSLDFFMALLKDRYLENRLECVIVLNEVHSPGARELLITTLLDKDQHPEIRAGAAWSLGELGNDEALQPLTKAFNEVSSEIRIEAARALAKLGGTSAPKMIGLLPGGNEDERAGLAWALSKSGKFSIDQLMSAMTDDNARRWIAWIIGTQDEVRFVNDIEKLRKADNEVYFAVTVLWKILASWVNGLETY